MRSFAELVQASLGDSVGFGGSGSFVGGGIDPCPFVRPADSGLGSSATLITGSAGFCSAPLRAVNVDIVGLRLVMCTALALKVLSGQSFGYCGLAQIHQVGVRVWMMRRNDLHLQWFAKTVRDKNSRRLSFGYFGGVVED